MAGKTALLKDLYQFTRFHDRMRQLIAVTADHVHGMSI
jgi:hypothetical protein